MGADQLSRVAVRSEGQLEVLAPRCALILRRIPLCSASGPAPSEPGGRGAIAPAGAEGAGVPRPRPGCGARRGQLGEHVAGKGPRELVFTTDSGAPLRTSNFRQRYWLVAVKARGLAGLRVRDLRQTAASLAVNSGANPKVVQQMLGHASAAMTLDVYAGLFNPDLDDVADRLDEAARAAGSVSQVCPIERSAGTIGSVDEGQDDDDDGLGGVAAHVR